MAPPTGAIGADLTVPPILGRSSGRSSGRTILPYLSTAASCAASSSSKYRSAKSAMGDRTADTALRLSLKVLIDLHTDSLHAGETLSPTKDGGGWAWALALKTRFGIGEPPSTRAASVTCRAGRTRGPGPADLGRGGCAQDIHFVVTACASCRSISSAMRCISAVISSRALILASMVFPTRKAMAMSLSRKSCCLLSSPSCSTNSSMRTIASCRS
mmetsp:Transcript_28666/g.72546  ORF Transcript_28666/g.72546 Transcript_28666/m.72546 type:complete len:215 (+) Transcript_28666:79-723(+)